MLKKLTRRRTVSCGGCSQPIRSSTKYQCVECVGVVICGHCQRGGIHGHHAIVEFSDARRNLPLASAVAATRTTAAVGVGPAVGQATSLYGLKEGRHRQPFTPRQSWGSPYDAGTPDQRQESTTFLPYGIDSPAAPSDVPPSTSRLLAHTEPSLEEGRHRQPFIPRQPRRSPFDAGTQDQRRQSTTFLPYGIVPEAPSAVTPSTNPRLTHTEPTRRQSSDVGNRASTCEQVVSPRPTSSSQSMHPYGLAPVAPPMSPVPQPSAANRPQNIDREHDAYPANWGPARSDASFNRVPLSESDPEFKAVIQNMVQNGGKKFKSKVVEICRIENYRLYGTYRSCREDLTRVNDSGTVNERTLWHGTGADVLGNIYRGGFNRSYCGKNATAYGDGVYFATSFDYSASPRYSPPDAKGQKYIFQCRVLTGQFVQGQKGLKEPPMRTSEFRYDSVVDNVSGPSMFVVFRDMQVYPEYVITLKQ